MTNQNISTFKNHLLCALAPEDRRLLAPSLERMQLNLRQSLEKAHQPINFVYFFEAGLGSVVASKEGGSTVEVGLFGRDGMPPALSRRSVIDRSRSTFAWQPSISRSATRRSLSVTARTLACSRCW